MESAYSLRTQFEFNFLLTSATRALVQPAIFAYVQAYVKRYFSGSNLKTFRPNKPATEMTESWNTFASNTSLHGLRHVFGVSSWFRRIFWILCMLAAILFYIYILSSNIRKYKSLPIDTRTSYEFNKNGIPFPAVTICNLNHFDKFKLDLGYEDKRFKTQGLDISACDIAHNISGNLTCGHALLCATFEYARSIMKNCTTEIRDALKEALETSRSFDREEFVSRFGNEIESMLVGPCMFSFSENCSAKDFVPIISKAGLCHTFNNHMHEKNKHLHLAGAETGLRIILDTKGSWRTIGGRSVGFDVIIHNPSPVLPWSQGFHVQPGTNVKVLIQATKYIRLPKPYKSACSRKHLGDYGNYTREHCILKCANDAITQDCGCRLLGSPVSKEVPVCSFKAEKCSHEVLEKWSQGSCSCQLPCEEITYQSSTTYSKYPSETLLHVLKDRFNLNESETYLKSNLVNLRIGFADNTHQVFTEYPSYDGESLFADLGGSMGLLLGCSILTLVEFLDYLCMKIYAFLCSRNTRTAAEQNE
ncbi:acid-sensing ion channel 1A-like [Actinia tenebrosa]|uniref:Acid-sensing ion channel 1A-like n=1 Tax=Actinia tenebrosa TaxID=6105 RepID=A0A6P8IP54_ACTTE|nr:acid-sensing ion channel 1A-like [Actinia tenebrosa]